MRYLVRERLFSISDDSWVTDERGEKVFLVDGKALRLRETCIAICLDRIHDTEREH